MRTIYALAVVAFLGGCAAKVVQSTPRTAMINAADHDAAGALNMAQTECGKYGRSARLNAQPRENRLWVFDCVE